MMRDSSLAAFRGILEQLSTKRGKVFGVFYASDQPLCDYVVAEKLGWAINCVTGRRRELEQMGYLIDCGKRSAPPVGLEVHHFSINPAALVEGFVAKPLPRKEDWAMKRIMKISPQDAARRLALARKGTKQKPVRRVPLPLFE